MAGKVLFVLPNESALPPSGAVAGKRSEERRAMRVRSGIETFRVTVCVFWFGRSSSGVVMSLPNTLVSVSPLTDGSYEQIELDN